MALVSDIRLNVWSPSYRILTQYAYSGLEPGRGLIRLPIHQRNPRGYFLAIDSLWDVSCSLIVVLHVFINRPVLGERSHWKGYASVNEGLDKPDDAEEFNRSFRAKCETDKAVYKT